MTSSALSTPLRMSQSCSDVFRKAVTYIITEWPSLELAIENGMGGDQARAKRDWICTTIAEVMLREKDIDLEDYLGEMINAEFDTLIEDGSLEYNSKWIEKFYKDCLQGKEVEVLDSINQAAKKKLSLGNVKIPPPVCQTQDTSEDSMDDDKD